MENSSDFNNDSLPPNQNQLQTDGQEKDKTGSQNQTELNSQSQAELGENQIIKEPAPSFKKPLIIFLIIFFIICLITVTVFFALGTFNKKQQREKIPPSSETPSSEIPSYTIPSPSSDVQLLLGNAKNVPVNFNAQSFFNEKSQPLPDYADGAAYNGILSKITHNTVTVETLKGIIEYKIQEGKTAQTNTSVFIRTGYPSYEGNYISLQEFEKEDTGQIISIIVNEKTKYAYRIEIIR